MSDILPHWEKVLQGMAYWVAYKKQYFNGHLLLEGAIIAEFTQLLSAKLEFPLRIKCEMMYHDLLDSIYDQTRIDLAIGKNGKEIFTIEEAIEVKRYEINKNVDNYKNIQKDLERLYRLKDMSKVPSLFLVVIGQHKLPVRFFGKNNGMRTSNIYEGNLPFIAKPVMSRKAINSKGYGSFALLIEVQI